MVPRGQPATRTCAVLTGQVRFKWQAAPNAICTLFSSPLFEVIMRLDVSLEPVDLCGVLGERHDVKIVDKTRRAQ